jgi:PAS domain S-box-containing protein
MCTPRPTDRYKRLAAIVESCEDAIIGKDMDGIITEWNRGAEQLYGYSAHEVIGKSISLLIPTDHSDDFAVIMRKLRRGESVTHYETVRQKKDGGRIDVSVSVSSIRNEAGEIVGASAIARDISERKRLEESLSTVTHKLIEAQEQERTRIARELHDDTVQRLALLAIEIAHLKKDIPHPTDDVLRRLDELEKTIVEIATDLQSLSHELHSSKLEYLGMVPAMTSFCEEFGEQRKVKVEFESHNMARSVPPDISLCLFRVLQEALHNSAKHSGACRFRVQLRGTSGEIHLIVSDSGAGFDLENALKSHGLGLTSMRERLHSLKGEISIESQPKRGTTIHARVPLSSDSRSRRLAG